MQGRRYRRVHAALGAGVAPLIVAGALLLSVSVPAAAQDVATPPADAAAEGTLPTTDAPADAAAVDPAAAPADAAAAPADAAAADPAAAQTENDGGGGRNREGRGGGQEVAGVPSVGVGSSSFGGELAALAIVAATGAAAAALRLRPGAR
jgi:hypothetical protein